MKKTIAEKIIEKHLVSGEMTSGKEIAIKIDQTLTQDATGTMAYLEFESMGISRVKTEKSVAYVDHNTMQSGFENADDHRYIQSVADKYGIYFSRPGNGICHQVHYERFGKPGKTLIGSDSHTPTGGGLGMLAMGAGGMDVAVAMAGGAYNIVMPKIMKVNLSGKLNAGVSAKDIILEILRQLSVKGGVGYILEYAGSGLMNLSVPERCTIANMGAELGATTSIFPSDEMTKQFLEAQERGEDWIELKSDDDAEYDKVLDINLEDIVALAACPNSPDNVEKVSNLSNVKVDQVCIGSCTNSSLSDMLTVAAMLRNKKIADGVCLAISPGSRQVLTMLAECGALADMIDAGARILECTCGPCIGMGMAPNSKGVSLRTFNRNFLGRSGTKDGQVYLVSPETAAASALAGYITNAAENLAISRDEVKKLYDVPEKFRINDSGIIAPSDEEKAKGVEVIKGPNIKSLPEIEPLPNSINAEVILKVGDNITTDHIMPAGAKILPYRSNIPYLSRFCFEIVDSTFAERAKAAGRGIIVGGQNYGQGSSREHAALVPVSLGIKTVIAKSFARIHQANLVNAGILPLVFDNPKDYDKVEQGVQITLDNIYENLNAGVFDVCLGGENIKLRVELADRQKEILLAGGLLKYTAEKSGK